MPTTTGDTVPVQRRALGELLQRARLLVGQLEGLLAQGEPDSGAPAWLADTALVERVGKVGESAWLHRRHLEEHGELTVADSREIRRSLSVPMRSTANHFGRAGEGAILHRDVPADTPTRADQPVRLTEEGQRMADLWEQLHAPDG